MTTKMTTIACIGDMAVDDAVAIVVARMFVMLAMWKRSMSEAPPLPSWIGRARSSSKRDTTTVGHGYGKWRPSTGRRRRHRHSFFSCRPSWLLLASLAPAPLLLSYSTLLN